MATPSNIKKRKIEVEHRVFNEEWQEKYFFTILKGKPVCLVCSESVSVLKEYNLRRHYETKHSTELDIFTGLKRKQKSDELKRYLCLFFNTLACLTLIQIFFLNRGLSKQQTFFTRGKTESENAVRASFAVSEILAKKMKPFQDVELIKECLSAVIDIVCPKEKAVISNISLSRNPVTRRVKILSDDLKTTLREKSSLFSFYSLAIDESIDVKNTAQLAILIRGINASFQVTEELAALVPMKSTTTGKDLMEAVMTCMKDLELSFKNLSGLATDGAPSMTGKKTGVVALVRNEKQLQGYGDIIPTHCIIHQENLCAKTLNIPEVMTFVVKTINFIKARGLNNRQFQLMLTEMESEYGDLLYYCEVRWLSRGAMLERFYVLRKEVAQFLQEKGKSVSEINDPDWVRDLAFLVDITKHLNDLNAKLQGKDQHIGLLFSHIKAFQTKLTLWHTQLVAGNLVHFPLLAENSPSKLAKYAVKIKALQQEFERRFADFREYSTDIAMFSTPFTVDMNTVPEKFQMEIINLQCNDELKSKFHEVPLINFYRDYVNEENFPVLRCHAMKMLSLFGSTYLCEQLFSRMKTIKSNCRSSLTDENLESCLRISVTDSEINMNRVLESSKQFQVSH